MSSFNASSVAHRVVWIDGWLPKTLSTRLHQRLVAQGGALNATYQQVKTHCHIPNAEASPLDLLVAMLDWEDKKDAKAADDAANATARAATESMEIENEDKKPAAVTSSLAAAVGAPPSRPG